MLAMGCARSGSVSAPSCTNEPTLKEQRGEPIWFTGSAEVRPARSTIEQWLAGGPVTVSTPGRAWSALRFRLLWSNTNQGENANGNADDEVAVD